MPGSGHADADPRWSIFPDVGAACDDRRYVRVRQEPFRDVNRRKASPATGTLPLLSESHHLPRDGTFVGKLAKKRITKNVCTTRGVDGMKSVPTAPMQRSKVVPRRLLSPSDVGSGPLGHDKGP